MKRKVLKKKNYKHLDKTTFTILACVVVALLVIFGLQTGTLPKFLLK